MTRENPPGVYRKTASEIGRLRFEVPTHSQKMRMDGARRIRGGLKADLFQFLNEFSKQPADGEEELAAAGVAYGATDGNGA
jgi:hypothetical protein